MCSGGGGGGGYYKMLCISALKQASLSLLSAHPTRKIDPVSETVLEVNHPFVFPRSLPS